MVVPDSSEQESVQRRTTLVSIAAASLLVILKLGVGLIAGSLALVSAGIESSGDVLAAILTFFAVRLGGQPADGENARVASGYFRPAMCLPCPLGAALALGCPRAAA